MIAPSLTLQRIASLDVLRGFALLGILLMNIQSFSMPGAAYLNPYSFGDLQGTNYLVWLFSHFFADQKFMSLFSMLFGAGILIFSRGIEAKGLHSARLHYRRTLWLLMFGLMHGYLFWYGDILFSYAMCGFWVYLLRKRSVTTLFILGTVFIAISSVLDFLTGFVVLHMSSEERAAIVSFWQPSQAFMDKEIAAYTGSWLSAFSYRLDSTFFMQTQVFLTTFVWRAGGMMLLGMGLYKAGFFTPRFSTRFYAWLSLTGMVLGLGLIYWGLQLNLQHSFSLEFSMFIGNQYNYWGSVFVAIAYAAIFMIIVKKQWMMRWQNRLAAVGRMAFSHYILQTVLCTTLFYSMGYLATFSRVEQLLTVFMVWALQLVIAPMWLHRFKFGPMEWLWRSLTYWQWQPMLVSAAQRSDSPAHKINE